MNRPQFLAALWIVFAGACALAGRTPGMYFGIGTASLWLMTDHICRRLDRR